MANLGGRISDLVASIMAFCTEEETGPALEQRVLEIEVQCDALKRDVRREAEKKK